MDAWADYFRDLVTPTNSDDSPDSNFHQIIKEQYSKVLQDTSFDPEPITFSQEEVSETINSLKPNKAAGPDAIDPENLIFGGESLITHLTALFNAMIVAMHIPEVFHLNWFGNPYPQLQRPQQRPICPQQLSWNNNTI